MSQTGEAAPGDPGGARSVEEKLVVVRTVKTKSTLSTTADGAGTKAGQLPPAWEHRDTQH
jgi:hypothetical protein